MGTRNLCYFARVCCEGLEGFAVDAHDAPLVEHVGSHLFVEVDGGLVPVEDVPLEAVAVLEGYGGEVAEEGFGDSSAAELGADEEVFEVDAGVAAPGGVEGEVEGEGGGLGYSVFGPLGDEAGEDFLRAEAVAEEVGFGGYDGVGLALVGGEVADEGEDLGDVVGCGGADMEQVGSCRLQVVSCLRRVDQLQVVGC